MAKQEVRTTSRARDDRQVLVRLRGGETSLARSGVPLEGGLRAMSAEVKSCIICGKANVPGTRYCGGDRGCQTPAPLPYKGGEERAEDGKPYFRIDGVALEDADGETIYKEYRKTPLGDNTIGNGGVFRYDITSGDGR